MGKLTCLKQGPGATPHRVGQDMAAVFPGGGVGRLPVKAGTDVRSAYPLPGKPAEAHAPPLRELSRWRCSDLKIRTIATWGRGKHVGRSVM